MIFFSKNKPRSLPIKKQIRLCKDLSSLLSSGIPMAKALEIAKFPPEVYREILKGTSLSDSFCCFSKKIINMLKIGEKVGELPKTLFLSADFLEKEKNVKEKMFKKMLYPLIVVFASISSVIFFLCIIVPQLKVIFEDFGMPMPYEIKVLLSLNSLSWPIVFTFGGLFLAAHLITKKGLFLKYREYIKYYFPISGNILRKLSSANIIRSLALYLKSGYGLNQALSETNHASESTLFKAALARTHERVVSGIKLSDAIMQEKIFDPIIASMLSVAEESGQIENVLDKTCSLLEEEAEEKIKTITIFIEPLSTLLAGGCAAYVIFVMFSPMLKIFEFLE